MKLPYLAFLNVRLSSNFFSVSVLQMSSDIHRDTNERSVSVSGLGFRGGESLNQPRNRRVTLGTQRKGKSSCRNSSVRIEYTHTSNGSTSDHQHRVPERRFDLGRGIEEDVNEGREGCEK